jgi:hypothetical protein
VDFFFGGVSKDDWLRTSPPAPLSAAEVVSFRRCGEGEEEGSEQYSVSKRIFPVGQPQATQGDDVCWTQDQPTSSMMSLTGPPR